MEQILLHLLGDYILQNNEMAQRKTSSYLWAFIHAITYSLPFLLLTKGFNLAWFVIFITHFLIDRFRLARYWIMFYNLKWIRKKDRIKLTIKEPSYKVNDRFSTGNQQLLTTKIINKEDVYEIQCIKHEKGLKSYFNLFTVYNTPTGFSSKTPDWLSTWLLIIIDNTFHLVINYLSLTYLM